MPCRKTRLHLSRRAKWILYPALALGILNFTSFFLVAIYLGGDAINGSVTASGHYYLESHGHRVEVTQAIWTYSYWHAISVWFTHGLIFVLFAVFLATGDIRQETVEN